MINCFKTSRYKYRLYFFLSIIFSLRLYAQTEKPGYTLTSPDKKITLKFNETAGKVYYSIKLAGTQIIQNSKLGLIREDADFSEKLTIVSASITENVSDSYEILKGKRKRCDYKASKRVFHLKNATGQKMDIIFQVSNDGVAFRYFFPGSESGLKKIKEEITSFYLMKGSKAWLQPMADAQTSWCNTNPSYEEYYLKGIDIGTPSPYKAGWVYPALFNYKDFWVLITEAYLDKDYCATRLRQYSPDGEYSVGFPQEPERMPGGALYPESILPWYTPWRVLAIGSLKTITESTIGTDLAGPAVRKDEPWIMPGKASWSWALLKDDSTVFDVQKRFIDYAADMHWQYCLVDADWDRKIGIDKIKELAAYGKTKNVGILVWYNSSGSWNTTVYSPKGKLLTHEDREKEFGKLKDAGVKGIKVDFFAGDGQSMIQYYIDILEDAAKFNLLVNCHGATLPRGWHRTYPNLMTMESIKGFEFITFEQANANEAPQHCATIPFTRNLFDPMDFTPMCLYKIPNIQRKTTSTFELALSVLFISGIQHYAETPNGMSHVPAYVKTFLQGVPAYWEDSKFIDGYPGKLVVMARKSGNKWYVAGINGENIDKKLTLDLSFIDAAKSGILITDGNEELSFEKQNISLPEGKKLEISLKANGGLVIEF